MNTTSLPPLPPSDSYNADTCATVRLYLAVWNDLTPAQQEAASAHIAVCQRCLNEQRLMNRVTLLVTALDDSQPSARVDLAVMAAIAARSQQQFNGGKAATGGRKREGIASIFGIDSIFYKPQSPWETSIRYVSIVVAASLILLAIFTALRFTKQTTQNVFLLPATLSWSAYILYHTQTETDDQGQAYQVVSYHDLGSQRLHVETMQGNDLDIVYVGSMSDAMPSLAIDEIHHVAQWNAKDWSIDKGTETMFDPNELRHELQNQSATYTNKDSFHGQTVYRIRCKNGLTLLLDLHYNPVNVLVGAVGTGTGEPLFNTIRLLPRENFSDSMWSMQVPRGFSMGTLPAKP